MSAVDERPNLIVRPASAGDLDAVARVWHESASAMDGARDVPPLDALRRRIDAEIAAGWDLHVGTDALGVVGLLAIKRSESVLDQIFVAPDAQGRGVGSALLDAARRPMPQGFTLRMAAANASARRFYESRGLTRAGEGTHPISGVPVFFYAWQPD